MKLDNLDQFTSEECPYYDSCPLSSSDPRCTRFYIDCPRFIDYIKADAFLLERKEKENKEIN